MKRFWIAALVSVQCFILMPDNAFGRAMISRNDLNHGPGFNTGRGRFVDQDRLLAFELDALTTAKAQSMSDEKNRVQEWGTELQFNVAGFALGPEFWFGEYNKKNPGSNGAEVATDEFYRILYNRYQFMVSRFTYQEHMRGWYAKIGYSYTKIDAETNFVSNAESSSDTSYSTIDETRHGPAIGIGHRFTFWKNRSSLNIGLAYTKTTSREVTEVDTENLRRYDSVLANAGDKRLAAKDFPEARISFGLLF